MATHGETIGTVRGPAPVQSAWDAGSARLAALSDKRASIELVILVVLIETILWIVPVMPHARIAYGVIAALIALLLGYSYVRDGVSVRQLGLRFDNLPRALKSLAIPLGMFVLLVILLGFEFGAL